MLNKEQIKLEISRADDAVSGLLYLLDQDDCKEVDKWFLLIFGAHYNIIQVMQEMEESNYFTQEGIKHD